MFLAVGFMIKADKSYYLLDLHYLCHGCHVLISSGSAAVHVHRLTFVQFGRF